MTPLETTVDLQERSARVLREAFERNAVAPEQAVRALDVEVGGTPSEVVYRENKLELHHYERETAADYSPPILVVYALINRPYILDLQPSRSVVRRLRDEGFDVYMIDWGEPSRLDAELTLEDYVTRYIDNCVDVVRERSGEESVNVLGYCMGGTMSAMYAALEPEKVRNLALLATGLTFEGEGGVLELWGDDDYYSPAALTETLGNVPADFLDAGFALMDPVGNYVSKYLRLYDNLDDDEFVENFARMERWIGDGIDVAGETYRQFVEQIYQENRLARGELAVGGEHVDLSAISMPVLQIVGEYDHLVPPAASVPFNDLVGSDDTEVFEFPSGHVGLSVSTRAQTELWPDVCAWFSERSERRGEASADEEESEAEGERGGEKEADLEVVDGIGPAYAERLRNAGVETLADLVAADPEEVAADVDVSPARVRDWVTDARERLA